MITGCREGAKRAVEGCGGCGGLWHAVEGLGFRRFMRAMEGLGFRRFMRAVEGALMLSFPYITHLVKVFGCIPV